MTVVVVGAEYFHLPDLVYYGIVGVGYKVAGVADVHYYKMVGRVPAAVGYIVDTL